MSVKEYYKLKEVMEKTKVLEETYCEECGKLLNAYGIAKAIPLSNKGLFFRVVTGHNLWGNDSVDSIEVEYYCEDCLKQMFEKWLKQARHTHYFEVTCEGKIRDYEEYNTEGLEVK